MAKPTPSQRHPAAWKWRKPMTDDTIEEAFRQVEASE